MAKSSDSANLTPALEAAIDAERRNLQKAASMLGCLVIALEYGYDGYETEEPDYSDVVRAIRSMVDASVDRLEPLNPKRRPVKEAALAIEDD